jgi:hypothetical protein
MSNKRLPARSGVLLGLLRVVADILSIIFLGYWGYCFIWAHYYTGPNRPLPIQTKLLMADVLPSVFGFAWLVVRYYAPWVMKHPTILARTEDIRWRFGFGVIVLIVILIIKAMWG